MKTSGNSQEKSWMKVSKTQDGCTGVSVRYKNIFEAIDQIHSKKKKKKKRTVTRC